MKLSKLNFNISSRFLASFYYVVAFFLIYKIIVIASESAELMLNEYTPVIIIGIIGIIGAYYLKDKYLLIFSVLAIMLYWFGKTDEYIVETLQIDNFGSMIVSMSGLVFIGVICYMLGRKHETFGNHEKLANAYIAIGLLTITAMLFFLSSKTGIVFLSEVLPGETILQLPVIFTVISLAILFIVSYAVTLFKKGILSIDEFIEIAIVTILFLVLTIMPEQMTVVATESGNYVNYDANLSTVGILWALFFNALLLVDLVGLVIFSTKRANTVLINLSIILLFAFIIFKYFSFFDFLDKSIFFIGAGIILFVVGWFMEKQRRKILNEVKYRV